MEVWEGLGVQRSRSLGSGRELGGSGGGWGPEGGWESRRGLGFLEVQGGWGLQRGLQVREGVGVRVGGSSLSKIP